MNHHAFESSEAQELWLVNNGVAEMSHALPLREPKERETCLPDAMLKTEHGVQLEPCRQERCALELLTKRRAMETQ